LKKRDNDDILYKIEQNQLIVLPKEHDMDTKGIIIEAMKQLLAEQRFDKITVQNIIDRAHCSRGTFYRHFKDKYDIMNYYYLASVLSRRNLSLG